MKNLNLKIKIIFLISVLFFPLFFVSAQVNKFYMLDMKYLDGKILLNEVIVRNAEMSNKNSKNGDFRYELLSFQNKVLESGNFKIDRPLGAKFLEMRTTTGKIDNNRAKPILFTLKINYHKNGKTVNIYKTRDNKKMLEVDVSSFANTCGDSICQKYENYFNCKVDCPKVNDNNIGNTNAKGVKQTTKRINKLFPIIIMGFVILASIILIIFGVKYFRKKKY